MINNSLKVLDELDESSIDGMYDTGVPALRTDITSPNADGSTISCGSSIRILVGNAYDYETGSIEDILSDLVTTSQPNLDCSPEAASLGKLENKVCVCCRM